MSNVIKSFAYMTIDDKKVVEVAPLNQIHTNNPAEQDDGSNAMSETAELEKKYIEMGEQIVRDAEAYAEEQVRLVNQEAERTKEQAQHEIETWWQERRSHDEQYVQELQDAGFRQGHQDGVAQAEAEIHEQYANMLDEARRILEQAYNLKEQIIQEAEPFLVELSCSIAGKIVDKQLTVAPEWSLDIVRGILSRRRERGLITLCVSPEQFSYMQDLKDELTMAVDSQAELQILPDASVQDKGCVVRSSFGSIDARIDTQLTEIKHALQQVAYSQKDLQEDR